MKIIFLNDHKLAHNMKEGRVTNYEKLFYLLFFLLGSDLVSLFVTRFPKVFIQYQDNYVNSYEESSYLYYFLVPLLSLAIKAYAIFSSYKINSMGDNENFVERMVCLVFPVAIRMFILLIIIKFLVFVLKNFLSNFEYVLELITVIDKMSMLIIALYFYLRLTKAIKIVSS